MSPSNGPMQNARGRLIPAALLVASAFLAVGVGCGTGGGRSDVASGTSDLNASTSHTTQAGALTTEPVLTLAPTGPTVPATQASRDCVAASPPPEIDPATGIPITTTALAPPGCTTTTPTLPPGKVRCTIFYGTIVEGMEKDLPVYRADTHEQIATIHVPGWTWTPAEAEELCA